MTGDRPVQGGEEPDLVAEENERSVDVWKLIVFALLGLILALILLGVFRFFAVRGYGGI